MMRVYPSGSERAATSAPIAPPAPGRLSTTTGWPKDSETRVPIIRPSRSVPPPGANGEIMRMGLLGYLSADAPNARPHAINIQADTTAFCIPTLLVGCVDDATGRCIANAPYVLLLVGCV